MPFKVYVGFGNNSNLVKAIIKKRFWFELTKNKEEAHFVWVQLKDEDAFARQLEKYEEKSKIYETQKLKPKIVKVESEQKTASTFALENS